MREGHGASPRKLMGSVTVWRLLASVLAVLIMTRMAAVLMAATAAAFIRGNKVTRTRFLEPD